MNSKMKWSKIRELDIHISDGNYSSKYPRSSEFISSGIPFIRANNLVNRTISSDDMYFISEEKHKVLAKGHIKTNDILITTRGNLGTVALVPESYEDANINAQIVLLRANPEQISPNFLVWCFSIPEVQNQISQLQTGTALKQLPVGKLTEIEIPLPPIAEQKRIAAILEKADAIRRKRQEAIRLTEELGRSLFLDMFGDPVTNPKGWKIFSLEDITEKIVDCPHSTPKWSNSGVICLRTSNLTEGGWNWDDTRYITEEDYKTRTQRSEIIAGDIILSREGTVGIAAIVPENLRVCMGQRLVQVRPDLEQITSRYLLNILLWELSPEHLGKLMRGSTSQHLNVKDLRSMPIPVPPLELQESFSESSKKINLLNQKMDDFSEENNNNFNSLLQRAFKGEL